MPTKVDLTDAGCPFGGWAGAVSALTLLESPAVSFNAALVVLAEEVVNERMPTIMLRYM